MITFLLAFVAQQGQLKIAVLFIVVGVVCVCHQPKGKEPEGKKHFEFLSKQRLPQPGHKKFMSSQYPKLLQ